MAPKGAAWEQAVEYWKTLNSDDGATYDIEVELDAADIEPYVSWGTSPEMVGPIGGVVPNPADIDDDAKRQTVEGALGSLATSVALAWALNEPMLGDRVELPVWGALLTGVVLNFTTQTGDLIESLLKRRCNAKDSSTLLPAHGGILDLVDSLLFSFCAWFLVLVLLT